MRLAEAKMMQHLGRRIDQGEGLHLAGLVKGLQVREQKGMVAGLDSNDVVGIGLAEVTQVRSIGN